MAKFSFFAEILIKNLTFLPKKGRITISKHKGEKNMLEKVKNMLSEALNVSASKITADSKIVDDLGADSLDVVELLASLEDEYGITIPEEDIENLTTVGDVVKEIEKLAK